MDKRDNIKKGQSVLRIRMNRNNKDESSFDLMKIPVEHFYQEALCEIGEQESYIEELKTIIQNLQEENDKLKKQSTKIENRELRLEIKREEIYTHQQNLIKSLRKKNTELKERINNIIATVVSSNQIIGDLQNKLQEKVSQ